LQLRRNKRITTHRTLAGLKDDLAEIAYAFRA
jgi:hypothetical protein